MGQNGSAVIALQTALQKDGESVSITSTFDEQTASAVTGFQEKYISDILTPVGLNHGTGYVGVSTRARLNKLYSCGTTPPPFACAQVITPAQNPQTGECKNFPTPCAVPSGWQKVSQCASPTCSAPVCQEGSTSYDTGGKDSNNCPIIKCISSTGNQPPIISGISGPTILKVGETGMWTVKASDPENGYLVYSVSWGDNLSETPTTNSGPASYSQTATFTHSYSKAGIYNPTFIVTDNQGLYAETSVSVNVGNATQPSISYTASPTTVSAGQPSTLTLSTTNTNSCSVAERESNATNSVSLVYPYQTTTYTVTCTGPGGTTSKSVTVTVVDSGVSKTAAITSSLVVPSGSRVTLSGTARAGSSIRLVVGGDEGGMGGLDGGTVTVKSDGTWSIALGAFSIGSYPIIIQSPSSSSLGPIIANGTLIVTAPAISGLTATQVQAILSLLSSFGANSTTVANMNTVLNGGTLTTSPISSGLTSAQIQSVLSILTSFGASSTIITNVTSVLGNGTPTVVIVPPGFQTWTTPGNYYFVVPPV